MKLTKRLCEIGLLMVMLAFAGAIAVHAGSVNSSWNGGTGNWNQAADWTPSGVPNNGGGNTYNVTIDSGGSDLVTLNQNATVASLTLGGTTGSSTLQNLSGTAENLTVTGAGTINGTGVLEFANASTLAFGSLTVAAGSQEYFNGASALTVNGNLTNNSTTFSTGQLLAGGGNTLTVKGGFTNNGTLSMYGAAFGTGTGDTLNVSGTLTNAAVATLYLVDNSADVANVGSLSNSGTVYIGTGATLNLTNQPNGITDVAAGSALTVNGTLKAGTANGLAKLGSIEGSLTLGNGVTTAVTPGSGTLTLSSGSALVLNNSGTTLSVTGTLSDGGDVVVNSGTTLNLTQSMTDLPAGGTFQLAGSTNALAKLTSVEGVLYLNNGQTTSVTPNGGTLTLAAGSQEYFNGASGLTVNGNLTNNSTIFSTGELVAGGGNTVTVTGNFTNNGSLTMYGAGFGTGTADTLNVTGTLANGAGGSLTLIDNSADVANVGSLSNSGTVYIGTGTTLNLTNQPNGITDVSAGSALTVNGTLNAGTANGLAKLGSIEGSLTLGNGVTTADTPGTGTLTLASGSGLTLNNTGTTLSVTGTLNDGGDVIVNSGTTLNLTQSMTDLPAGGTFQLAGSTNALAKLTSVEGILYLNNGQITSVTPNGGTLTLAAGSQEYFNGASGLTVNGNLTNNSTIFSTGELVAGGGNTVTVTGNFTNNGSLTMYGAGFGTGTADTLNVTGTLTNGAGGTLTLIDNSADVANVGSLSNSGTVYIGTGTTLNLTNQPNGITDVSAGSALTVNGTLNAGAANGLAKLGSIEGSLTLGNGVTTADTPGTGTLTLASGSALTLNNTGTTLSVTGTLSDGGDVVVNSGTTLNLTQSMTDLPAGGEFQLAGSTNALAKLTSVEGILYLNNGQITSVTPNGGTLTLAAGSQEYFNGASGLTVNGNLTNNSTIFSTGELVAGGGNTVTVTGNFTNNGSLTMYGAAFGTGTADTLKVSGTLTNAAEATLDLVDNSADVANVRTLNNSGTITIGSGTVLNLTASGNNTNTGTIGVGDSSGAGTLKISAPAVTLSGTGNVTLSNNSVITATAATDVLTSGTTIEGTGNIGNGAMGFVNTGTVLANQSTALNIDVSTANFNNKGTVEATSGNLNIMGPTGNTTFFTNYNATTDTLTGGTYIANGKSIGWLGANITTLAASVTEESGGQIRNNFNGSGSNALAGLTSITSAGSLTIGGAPSFVDAGAFSNAGSLTILTGQSFSVGSLTQISGSTLTAGTYVLDANLDITGTAQTITTNAATLTLARGTIENTSNSTNALAGLATNTGKLTLASGATFSTTGNFSNTGTLTINSGSAFTVNGTLAQISGATLSGGTFVLGGNLKLGSGINITTNSSTLTLQGGTIESGTTNALAGLTTNTRSLTLANNASFTTTGNFTNNGALTVNSGSTFAITGNLTNYNSTTETLAGGSYTIGGTLSATGLNIQTDASNITLNGTGTLMNSSTGTSALANLNTISSAGSFTLATNANFTAAGNFTNSGALSINKGSKFTLTGSNVLTNLSSGTLASGTYTIGGTMQLTSANGGIVTNAANLTLTGTGASIKDGTANALAGFNSNTGTFALASNAIFTTGGSFTDSGTVTIAKGSQLSIGGSNQSYTQSAGTTNLDGTLAGGSATVTGGLFQGAGTVSKNLTIGGGGTTPTLNVGDAGTAGLLAITGTYTQLSTGTMTGLINGTTAGTGFSQLKITGAASLAGTVNFTVASGFQSSLTAGETFTVLTASSVTGTFSNSTISINSSFHFTVTYTSTGVVLTVASGPSTAGSMAAIQPAMASAKQNTAVTKAPVVISGLRHPIGVPAKWQRPVLVTAVKGEGEYLSAIGNRAWQQEYVPMAHAMPVISTWKPISERPIAVSRIDSGRPSAAVSNNWVGRNGERSPSATGLIGLTTRRPAMPIRMLPMQVPLMKTVAR